MMLEFWNELLEDKFYVFKKHGVAVNKLLSDSKIVTFLFGRKVFLCYISTSSVEGDSKMDFKDGRWL
jgi:hypothetical protein